MANVGAVKYPIVFSCFCFIIFCFACASGTGQPKPASSVIVSYRMAALQSPRHNSIFDAICMAPVHVAANRWRHCMLLSRMTSHMTSRDVTHDKLPAADVTRHKPAMYIILQFIRYTDYPWVPKKTNRSLCVQYPPSNGGSN